MSFWPDIVSKSKLFLVLGSAYVVFAFVYIFFISTKSSLQASDAARKSQQRELIVFEDSIRQQLLMHNNTLAAFLKTDGKYDPFTAAQFVSINSKIDSLTTQSLALRQAIQPLKPDEVLTIARLQDKIESFDKLILHQAEDIKQRQDNFEQSVIRESASIRSSNTTLYILMVPLIFNLLYNLWKDNRISKKEQHS